MGCTRARGCGVGLGTSDAVVDEREVKFNSLLIVFHFGYIRSHDQQERVERPGGLRSM
jgi:hypothetical protein